MCLAIFLHYYGRWNPAGQRSTHRNDRLTFSKRCSYGVSGYFLIRSLALALFAYLLLERKDVQGKVESFYTQSDADRCALCYQQAEANPNSNFEFSHCSSLLASNTTMYPNRDNLLVDVAGTNNIFSPTESSVQHLRDMNIAQISIWSIIFGMGLIVVITESLLKLSLPQIVGLTALHRSRYEYLVARGDEVTLENMCAFGLSEELVRMGNFHFRTVASFLTIPITLAVMNEHFRYVAGPGGCFVSVDYPHQELLNSLYYIESLGVLLLLYVSALLVLLLVICYCCRKHLYQLLRICFLVFIFVSLVLNFMAVFFLLANAARVSGQQPDVTQLTFAIVASVSALEIEWLLLCPCVFKILKHRENMQLLSKYQFETRNLKPRLAAECRMVALLRGLRPPREKKETLQAIPDLEGGISETKKSRSRCGESMAPHQREEKRLTGWEHPLEALALNELFDPSIFRIVNEFQSSSDGTMERVPLQDYLHYRLWKECDDLEEHEIRRVKRKLTKHRWRVWDEKKKVEMTPILV